MTEPLLPSPSLYESHTTTVRYWSFDLHHAPKDFQKCATTSLSLAITALLTAASPDQILGDEGAVYLQLKISAVHGHFTLDAEHKPMHRLPELLRTAASGMEAGHRLAILKLGPKWYAFALSVAADRSYDFALLMRRQFPGETPSRDQDRGFFIITDEGLVV